VIVGKGKGAYLYEGNRRYMQIVCRYVTKYRDCTKNADKVQITKEIVDQVTCRGGRFLGQDNRGKLYEVTEKQARVKVGQALRHKRRQKEGGNSERSFSERSDRHMTSERSASADMFGGHYRDRSESESFSSLGQFSQRSVGLNDSTHDVASQHGPLDGMAQFSSYNIGGAAAAGSITEITTYVPALPASVVSLSQRSGSDYSSCGGGSASQLNPYTQNASASSFNMSTGSMYGQQQQIAQHQQQPVLSTNLLLEGDEFDALGPDDFGDEFDSDQPYVSHSGVQPMAATSSSAANQTAGVDEAFSSLSITAQQAMQIPTAEELVSNGGLLEFD